MDVFIARQPIYDRSLNVFAYELLYRNDAETNLYSEENPDFATISVIVETFLSVGIEKLTNNKPGFINFTGNILTSDAIKVLPPQFLGIEILETTEPSDAVLGACAELKKIGYKIILDDYLLNDLSEKFISYADLIKMDFMQSSDEQLRDIVEKYKGCGIKFVAEKVETKGDYLKAKAYGYDYFQGFYFNRPSVIRGKDLLPIHGNALKIIELLQDDACEIGDIASVIGSDPGMAYKLFRLANSVMFGAKHRVININSAIVRIGLKEFKTWVLYIMLYGANRDKPNELIKLSMLHALIAEEICRQKNLRGGVSGFSLLGLFSLMDVIMDTPFEVILSQINIASNIKKALIDPEDDTYSAVIRLIRAYEDADWDAAKQAGALIQLSLEEYQGIYLKSILRCDQAFNELFKKAV